MIQIIEIYQKIEQASKQPMNAKALRLFESFMEVAIQFRKMIETLSTRDFILMSEQAMIRSHIAVTQKNFDKFNESVRYHLEKGEDLIEYIHSSLKMN